MVDDWLVEQQISRPGSPVISRGLQQFLDDETVNGSFTLGSAQRRIHTWTRTFGSTYRGQRLTNAELGYMIALFGESTLIRSFLQLCQQLEADPAGR